MKLTQSSVITEQGDLGLGVTPIHESKKEKEEKKETKDKKERK